MMTVGTGNGPVNAIDSALRKALIDYYPSLKDLKLTDYKVMISSSEKGTELLLEFYLNHLTQLTDIGPQLVYLQILLMHLTVLFLIVLLLSYLTI